ncbi:MAG: hydrogenase expression/formation protein HypE [Armatimonadetes bacterium]|nr:hydrogenase expression/formation protein HypE [Armatimonadota bacterium]
MTDANFTNVRCPIPSVDQSIVQLAHGGAGRIAQKLLDQVFRPILHNPALDELHDSARVTSESGKLAFSTDAFVVHPWRFPGGDIGSLAVHGTVNDLAMAGARPLALSMAFIIEEGFKIADLMTVIESMRNAADRARVAVVAADTKVVERGKGDGIFLVSSGIGEMVAERPILPTSVREGDRVIVSGCLARHGVAVMCARDGLDLDPVVESDSTLVHEPALALLKEGIEVHCFRDITRGGLATVLNEIASAGSVGIRIEEARTPVREDVASVCELLGLNPLYVACEGRFVAFVAEKHASRAIEILRDYDCSKGATDIGVVEGRAGQVVMKSLIGVDRVLDLLSGEQLPRIC